MKMLLIILGMAVITFSTRFALYFRAHRISLPTWLEEALRYVPVAVLTAIIMPMILMPKAELAIHWSNPWLMGGLASFVLGLWQQKTMLTILLGVSVFFAWRLLLT
ncbi:MAG: branched-chain amino acid transport [Proteobacteria bacterium]|nr:MAG: branched-chain amino acid transport [Pseudomonadota bacterium]